METYEKHQDRHSHADSTYLQYHKLYKPFINDCISEIEIGVLVAYIFFRSRVRILGFRDEV